MILDSYDSGPLILGGDVPMDDDPRPSFTLTLLKPWLMMTDLFFLFLTLGQMK